jgi:8-oxo-dGTP pyrophosphatase MutT (NUDIX family)
MPGYWSIFAGSIEKGESSMSCATRELKEESGIDISVDKIKYVKTIYVDTDFTMNIYMAEFDRLVKPNLNDEHTEYGWFSIDDLHLFPYDIDPVLVECIQKYKRSRFIL